MNIPLVDLKAQYVSIRNEIDEAIRSVIDSTTFIGGESVAQFERQFASFCGAQYCVGVANGTDALELALTALGVGAGDEVLTAANTFFATAEAIANAGAKVVFVDNDPQSYTIDVSKLRDRITDRTKAIIAVHLYGQPADMEPINAIAEEFGLKVIEDAAQAHGAEYREKRVGTLGDVACFSFYPGKNLGAYGDAGAVVTNNEELSRLIRMRANHGRVQKYDHEFEGMNSRLDSLQAAVLQAKLKHLSSWNEARRKHAAQYNKWLTNPNVVKPVELEYARHVYHLYVVRVKNRKEIHAFLKNRGIGTGIHYPIALPRLKAYEDRSFRPGEFPVAESFMNEILSLPMYPELTEDQIRLVAGSINEFGD